MRERWEDQPPSGTIVCERCGTLNADAFRFCSQCGRLLIRREVAAKGRAPHHLVPPWERRTAEPAMPLPRAGPLRSEGRQGIQEHNLPIPERCIVGTPLEEEFKFKLRLVFWWGVRELAGAFDPQLLRQADGAPPPTELVEEWTEGLYPLHAGVFTRLAGAHHQLDLLREALAGSEEGPLKPLQVVEAFEAMLSNLYQAMETAGKETFRLLWRKNWKLPKSVDPHDENISVSQVRRALEGNNLQQIAGWIKAMRDELQPLHQAVASQWRLSPALEQLGFGEVPAGTPLGTVLRELVPADSQPRRGTPLLGTSKGQQASHHLPGDQSVSVEAFASGLLALMIQKLERIYGILYTSEFDRFLQDLGLEIDHIPPWDR